MKRLDMFSKFSCTTKHLHKNSSSFALFNWMLRVKVKRDNQLQTSKSLQYNYIKYLDPYTVIFLYGVLVQYATEAPVQQVLKWKFQELIGDWQNPQCHLQQLCFNLQPQKNLPKLFIQINSLLRICIDISNCDTLLAETKSGTET